VSAETFNRVTAIASQPFKPEMRSDRIWYELQLARQQIGELRDMLAAVLRFEDGDNPHIYDDSEVEILDQARALLTRIEKDKRP